MTGKNTNVKDRRKIENIKERIGGGRTGMSREGPLEISWAVSYFQKTAERHRDSWWEFQKAITLLREAAGSGTRTGLQVINHLRQGAIIYMDCVWKEVRSYYTETRLMMPTITGGKRNAGVQAA
jgi:hypothetical protein